MKKILLLALFCLSVTLLEAKDASTIAKELDSQIPVKREVKFYANDFNLSVGFGSLSDLIGGLYMGLSSLANDELYEMAEDGSYLPTMSLYYGRQVSPVINIGFNLSYSQMLDQILYTGTENRAGRRLFSSVTMMPTVRFDWLRRDWVRCYSKLALGACVYVTNQKYDDAPQDDTINSVWSFAFDVVPFGISVGRSFYGFGEAGFSTIGFVRGGVGYRF